VGVNAHALFRSDHEAVLDRLLTDSVTALVKDGLISLERLAQDGVKVRAAAGAASFRRQGRLTVIREQMAERIEQLKSELESDAAAGQGRKQAARLRAATEREERCRKALVRLRELEIERDARKSKGDPKDKKGVRASTTDAEARVMKRRLPARLQRSGGGRSRQSSDRRGRDRHPRLRRWPAAPDARAAPGPLWPDAVLVSGRWRVSPVRRH
jgi:hypothetical protein